MHPPSPRHAAAAILIALWIIGLPVSSHTQAPNPPTPAEHAGLTDMVRLIEADSANQAWSSTVQPGMAAPFQLRVLGAAAEADRQADLAVTTFSAQPAGPSVPAIIRLAGTATMERRVPLVLDGARWVDLELLLDKPRPATTYKGHLALSAGRLYHTWEVTLATPTGQGTFFVEAIPPVKLVTHQPCEWFLVNRLRKCEPSDLSMTLTNRSESPFTRLRVRFEPPGSAPTKNTTSNFSLDSFSFWRKDTPLDLENREERTNVQLAAGRQLVLAARVKSLAAGEYGGALRFGAAEIADAAQEPRLPLIIQVRHHWLLPVTVILVGSILGWIGSKYVVAARKTRTLKRQVNALRARADDFARSEIVNRTWHCPSEATSYSLARVRVILSQLSDLSSSVGAMLFREEEIGDCNREAERRIAALESVRAIRLRIEARAWNRPAVQMAVRDLLVSMHQILEGATFADAQQAELDRLLQLAGTWASDETFVQRYREAIVSRLRREDQIPRLPEIQHVEPASVHDQLERLISRLPTEQEITQASVAQLEEYDSRAATLNLLWRERRMPWAAALVAEVQKDVGLDDLFRLVDSKAWDHVEANESELTLSKPDAMQLETYEVATLRLNSGVEGVGNRRLLYHPLHVAWRIVLAPAERQGPGWLVRLRGALRRADPPRANREVTVLTPDLKVIQSFPSAGRIEVTAGLRWEARREIPVAGSIALDVLPSRRYEFAFGWTEYAVVILGTAFAAATGISALYDATFGSPGQYLALLSWAAGAGTGANLFKELGSTMTAGGRADAPLGPASGATH
jgi:hypothetical protein